VVRRVKVEGRNRKQGNLFLAVLLGIGILVIPSLIIFQAVVHRHPALKAGIRLMQADGSAREILGEPMETSLWKYGRSRRGAATFRFRVSGPRGTAKATVSATLVGRKWRINYILLSAPDRKTVSLASVRGRMAD
jgi:hypothetical protein